MALYPLGMPLNRSRIMKNPLIKQIEQAIAGVSLAELGSDLLTAGIPCEIDVPEGDRRAGITIKPGFPADRFAASLEAQLRPAVLAAGADSVEFAVQWKVQTHAVQGTLAPKPGIKNVIAVASGKGGVGKSTTAVNLALAIAREGGSVGMLDTDMYGPSLPRMLGVQGQRPESLDGKSFEPLMAHGLQMISIGCLVNEEDPMIWRGPMVTQAVNQLAFQTNWRDLDYLVVDLPPGTGDTQLTLTQSVPVSGAIVITTPQDIALLDARKGLKMFEKVNVSILGIIENMSSFVCPECGHEEAIFGAGGGDQLAGESDVPLLGKLPLDIRIRKEADSGAPTVVSDPDGEIAARYGEIALRALAQLAARPVDHKRHFPNIAVEKG